MCEPALVLETALGRLDPIAAELALLAAGGEHWDHRERHWVVRARNLLVGDALGASLTLTLLRAALEHIGFVVGSGRRNELA